MNSTWLTVASRTRCAAPAVQRQPILQLFRGFQRYHGGRSSHAPTTGRKPSLAVRRHGIFGTKTFDFAVRNSRYSSTNKPNADLDVSDPSKLQPANTVGSHTEGVVEDASEQDESVTWRDYDPEGGMPLPNGELSQAEIDAVFGEGTDAETGNYILSVMHWRRMSGALIDIGLDFPRHMEVQRNQALRGLEYLRSLDSGFDEQAAGGRWAEEETERLREELRERAVSLKLYKPEEAVEEEESDQGTEYGREKSGQSTLERMRDHNEAIWQREQAEKEARARQEQAATLHAARGPLELSAGVQPSVALTNTDSFGDVEITGAQTQGWLKPVERKEWVKYYEDQATIIKDNSVPQLSLLQRLGPATLVLLFALTAFVVLSDQYTPPSSAARIFPDIPPAVTTLGAITACMLATFLLSRFPPLWRANSKYFCIVPAYPYAVSLVGAAFRHDTLSHLAVNLATLWLFGLSLHEDVGRGTFLAVFFGGCVLGGWAGLAHNVLAQRWMTYLFGASGGTLAVLAATCALRPNGSLPIWDVEVPHVTWMLVALYAAYELYGAFRFHAKTTVDHAGHFGGLVAGLVAAQRVRNRKYEREDGGVMKHTPAVEKIER